MNDYLAEARLNLKKKFLKETFDYLTNLGTPKTFKSSSSFPPIDKIDLIIEKGERCFKFKAPSLNLVDNISEYQRDSYGFGKSFSVQNDKFNWTNPNGVATLSMLMNEDLESEGEIWHIESSFNVSEKKHFRLVIPKKNNPLKDHHEFIESESFNVEDALKFAGLSEFECNQTLFHLFDYNNDQNDDDYFLFIDSMNSMEYHEFEKSIGAISYSLGMITGEVLRNEMFILQSPDNDFKSISGFQYRRLEDSISSGMEIVSPHLPWEITRSNSQGGHVNLEVFSNIVNKARQDKRFLRALKIISEANEYPLEIRASAYSVALETVKNIVVEENSEKINPFKDKKIAGKVIKSLKEIVIPLEDSLFNNKATVINKLEQINQVTNKDSFKIAFDLCGFILTDIDEMALLKRNDFLHGRIPFENEEEAKQNQELKFITYKLHFLVTSLIMKYSKFSGLLKNNPKFFSVFANDNKVIDEPLFRKV
ncbi:hypothetical protein [Flavobacterium flavigenum]|uniref:hypothetical protein n=1 Tax=Flavobacterium flavigenum TaxID=3003258 RepID=UPI0024825B43|nr:hypothetical protein [Flavobacterium flavigenum]